MGGWCGSDMMIVVELTLRSVYALRRTSAGKRGHLNIRSAGKDLRRVRVRLSPTTWMHFEGWPVHRRPPAEIAVKPGLEPAAVYVCSSRVLQEVRRCCAEIEGELGDDCDLDVS